MNHSTLQRRGFTLWQMALLLAVVGILALVFWPVFGRGEPTPRRASCQSNLKQIMLGVKQYLQDYDEKHPVIATSKPSFGWAGALQPYVKSTRIFQCPSETIAPGIDPSQTRYTDYWFNARMGSLKEGYLNAQALTITLGDGDSDNARYHLLQIPQRWTSDTNSPLYRHTEGANFAFADGHAKWLKANGWKDTLDYVPSGGPTFRLKPLY